MDTLFLVLLLLVNINGLLLLALRETEVMGFLLAFHLATLAGLLITLPYGKFVHVVYRYVALVRNRQEDQNELAGLGAKA